MNDETFALERSFSCIQLEKPRHSKMFLFAKPVSNKAFFLLGAACF